MDSSAGPTSWTCVAGWSSRRIPSPVLLGAPHVRAGLRRRVPDCGHEASQTGSCAARRPKRGLIEEAARSSGLRSGATRPRGGSGSLTGVQHDLANPDGLRGDLHTLVLPAELQALLEGQLLRRDQLLEV